MTDLKRLPLWVGPFNDLLDDIRLKPFDWQGNECVVAFASRVVQVLTGVDFGSEYAGRFNDAKSAYRVLRDEGFDDVADLIASRLPEYAHPSEAHVGDLVTVPVDTIFKHAVGVVNGERIFALTEAGVGTLDRSRADRAFRVG